MVPVTAAQPPDLDALLEQAHLCCLRGDFGCARELLEAVLLVDPGNAAARKLRDEAERASVERDSAAFGEAERQQDAYLDPRQRAAWIAGGLALIGLGVLFGAGPVAAGLRLGFGTQVWSHVPFLGGRGPGRYPIHLLLLEPLLLVAGGAYMLLRVLRQYR